MPVSLHTLGRLQKARPAISVPGIQLISRDSQSLASLPVIVTVPTSQRDLSGPQGWSWGLTLQQEGKESPS